MLADKAAGMEEELRALEEKLAAAEQKLSERQTELEALKSAPPPEPERVEVAVIPESVNESMAEIAARAESIADAIEEKKKALA
jgi:cell division protein ZapA